MIGRHPFLWRSGGLLVLASMLGGCNEAPPVAETPPPPVSVSQPLVRDVIEYDDYDGRIAAIPTVEVRARVRGHLFKINFEDGQMVKEGHLLFEIDPRPFKTELEAAESLHAAAEAANKLAKVTVDRDSRLVS